MRLSRYFIAQEVWICRHFSKPLPTLRPELLRAQGIIPANDVGKQGSLIKNNKRAREDDSPGPSRSRPKIEVKSEDFSGDARSERIRALQVSQDIVCFHRVAPDEAYM